ncbi:MAG: hypothetical protein KKF44_07770 [Nanoarchaeota archaeon]|nr:hypothetical protein [Nanoarchaeota archaeon]
MTQDIAEFLVKWGFNVESVLPDFFLEKSKGISAYLDGESALDAIIGDLKQFKDSEVYLVSDTRVYDRTLTDLVDVLDKKHNFYRKLRDENPGLYNYYVNAPKIFRNIIELHYKVFKNCFLPDEDWNKLLEMVRSDGITAPQAMLLESVPDFRMARLTSAVELFNYADYRFGNTKKFIVMPKSSYEWSHKSAFHLVKKKLHQAFVLRQGIKRFADHGADGILEMQPHSEKETDEYCKKFGIPVYMNVNPQSGFEINRIPIDMQKAFSLVDNIINDPMADPFADYLQKLEENGEGNNHNIIFLAPDKGAIPAAEAFVTKKTHGYKFIASKGFRKAEGEKKYEGSLSLDEALKLGLKSPSHYISDMEEHLRGISKENSSATIKFIILDDMANTLGTADNEAKERIKQVTEFNDTYTTSLNAEVECWVTHSRSPYLELVKKKIDKGNISKIVMLDSVHYEPSLEDQLETLEIQDKVKVIPATAYQLAMGIALNHLVNKDNYVDHAINTSRGKRLRNRSTIPPRLSPVYPAAAYA